MTTFEATIKNINYWWARDLMRQLDYKDWHTFTHLIKEAARTLIIIDIPYYENIIPNEREIEGKMTYDFKLSRFACFLVVMSADYKKEKVADAQRSFVSKAEKYGVYQKDLFELERLKIREELGAVSKWLSTMASQVGVKDFATFNDAGYQGMYGMHARQVHDMRDLPKGAAQQEYMGSTELAANLLRVALTEQELWVSKKKGQVNAEIVHQQVGKSLRNVIKKHTGGFPEQLPVYRKLSKVKKQLKIGHHHMTAKQPI